MDGIIAEKRLSKTIQVTHDRNKLECYWQIT